MKISAVGVAEICSHSFLRLCVFQLLIDSCIIQLNRIGLTHCGTRLECVCVVKRCPSFPSPAVLLNWVTSLC